MTELLLPGFVAMTDKPRLQNGLRLGVLIASTSSRLGHLRSSRTGHLSTKQLWTCSGQTSNIIAIES
jgi:hypothetical protein